MNARPMKRIALLTVLAGLTGAGVALAADTKEPPAGPAPSGVSRQDLAQGTAENGVQVETDGPTDVVHKLTTIDAAGTSGWHSHPGVEVATVASGTATYRNAESDCAVETYEPGRTLVIPSGSVHLVTNDGADPVEVYVVSFNEPGEAPVKAEAPPACAEAAPAAKG